MVERQNFPALEELKNDTEGVDTLIELSPPWLEPWIDWVFETEYLARKQELLERRDEERRRYQEGRKRIESTYGTVVVRARQRRADGDQPRFEAEKIMTELKDAKIAIDDLHEDLNEDFLIPAERRKLSELESEIVEAKEYVRNKVAFDEQQEQLVPEIQAFEDRFAPYSGGDEYMVTADREYLLEQSNEVWARLNDLARELQLSVLPEQDAAWLSEKKTRFSELVNLLPNYNEEFVEKERERHSELLEEQPENSLNEQQQKAVVRNDRRNLIDASAGTGKTFTLTYRFLYLLEKGVPAADIAAITYTTDAAAEMEERIASLADVDKEQLTVQTIHSLALSIIQEATVGSPDGDPGEARKALVDEYLEAALAGREADEVDLDYPEVYDDFLTAFEEFTTVDRRENYVAKQKPNSQPRKEFLREKLNEFVDEARTFGLSPDDIRAKIDASNPVKFYFAAAGSSLLEAYHRQIEESEHPLDFDEMIYTATNLVESYPAEFGSRYSHLLVDEFQDVSESDLAFIEAFMKGDDDTHLFCVGDDWQSIFGFNGSNVRYFTEYEERFDDVTYTPLTVNYRCPPSIVGAGADLMAQSQAPQNEKTVRAFKNLDTDPVLHRLTGLYQPRVPGYIADLVEEQFEAGRTWDDIMVLSRNDEKSAYLADLREELADRGVPHERPDYEKDFLPPSYRDELDLEVEFDDKGNAQFVSGPDDVRGDAPPMLSIQSIHASKGTEAPVVILAHATDDDPDGIPKEERTDDLIEPAMEVTADHLPEERRLFYVALTRCEEEFHAVGKAGQISRYIEDINEYFDVAVPDDTLVGVCTEFNPSTGNRPVKATLDCDGFEAPLMAWPNNDPPRLEEGAVYRITDPEITDDGYGEEVRYDRSDIQLVAEAEHMDSIH